VATAQTSIFFPLHTSVELFEDRTSPAAVVRAKEAALLYDRLIFETGMLDVTISSEGSFIFWNPPDALTPAMRERTRQVIPLGEPVAFMMGKEPEFGVSPPPEEMHVMSHGELAAQYIAEFHTGVLDELAQFTPDWVTTVPGSGRDIPFPSEFGPMIPDGSPVPRMIGQMNFRDLDDHSLAPGANDFVRSYVYKAFNRDAVVAATHRSSLSVTPLFRPMVERRGIRPESSGASALAIMVPNVGGLPWEAVIEFHDHPGGQEARAKLREFDELAAQGDAEAANAYLLAVGQEVTNMLFQVIEDQRKGLPEQMAEEAIKTAVSLVPVVGPVVEFAASTADSVVDFRRFNRSWIAALMELRDRA
jgi:hypothetical protein